MQAFETLAIVGNGFDCAHGYHTRYDQFTRTVRADCLDVFRQYCEGDPDIRTWYAFEENIRILTGKLFADSFTEDCDYTANRQRLRTLTEAFAQIHDLLIRYLREETARFPLTRLPNVARYLNDGAFAVNFNYTDTAKAYTSHVSHVHGSLEESNIILGYDYRDEPCLSQYEDMRWSKRLCRQTLALRRYLCETQHLPADSDVFREWMAQWESYCEYAQSGRGPDIDLCALLSHYTRLEQFAKQHDANALYPCIPYDRVRRVAVLGHGIEADQVYLSGLMEKCRNPESVILFTYKGEPPEDIRRKADFFLPYCTDISLVPYQ